MYAAGVGLSTAAACVSVATSLVVAAVGAAGAIWGGLAAAAPSGRAAAGSMAPMMSPTVISVPSSALTCSTPDSGAGTSSVTLSDSISTRVSSFSTQSPERFCQGPTTTSVTDSPGLGIVI